MKLIFCLDSEGGFSFNNRRQSRDRGLNEYIFGLSKGGKLWMDSYSSALFDGFPIYTDENYFLKAAPEDFCFAEGNLPDLSDSRLDELIVCRWNRLYPHDSVLSIDGLWKLYKTEEIPGTSHEKITVDFYRRTAF